MNKRELNINTSILQLLRSKINLVAVSGGADSMVLCDILLKENVRFSIAHCNFMLRGEESDDDEEFVKLFAERNNLPFYSKCFSTEAYSIENKLSVQVAARELRYDWFKELMKEHDLDLLLTAHHQNDNVETVLMNFLKGTGIAGLRGIEEKRNEIVRPLLQITKDEILQYAKDNQIEFREDSSNASIKYSRNFLRNEWLPQVEKLYPQVQQNIAANIVRMKEAEILLNEIIGLKKKKLLELKGNEIHIPALKLLKQQPLQTIVHEIFSAYGFTSAQTKEIIKLSESGSGKQINSATHRILKDRKFLIISSLQEKNTPHRLIEQDEHEVVFDLGKLIFTHVENMEFQDDRLIAQLDADEINFPLLLRKWKTGDYFYPLGMKHKKKLSRFFIDQKLSLNQKENTYVIEQNKKIIWVIGIRIDDRFKITPKTKKVLQIKFLPAQ